jgi:hypothetical protein
VTYLSEIQQRDAALRQATLMHYGCCAVGGYALGATLYWVFPGQEFIAGVSAISGVFLGWCLTISRQFFIEPLLSTPAPTEER